MTAITLTINDDATMTVSTGEQSTPVQSLDEALQAIQQLATAATGSAPEEQPEEMQQEQAMMDSFRPGTTGR